jgi:hypothetical protein|tara:strand:- start:77 stop:436 length:360 start_codon:yes stop_codon:yes gene_type:complete
MSSKSRGLGDDIEKITKATGIKAVVDKISEVTGKPCKCEERKNLLNKWFPKKGHLSESEFDFLTMFFETYNGTSLKSEEERDHIYTIYNRVNKLNEKPTGCSPCLNNVVQNLKHKLDEY